VEELRLTFVKYKFGHLALGGTFDFLHKGHRKFLDFAFAEAEFVSIGITTDEFTQRNGKNQARAFRARLADLASYLKKKGFDRRSKIIFLDDIYGSAAVDKTIDGILVTAETQEGATLINKKRAAIGLVPLTVLEFPVIAAFDNKPISSSRIRYGEIDREGNSYFSKMGNRDYYLPDNLRLELSKPHGKLFKNVDDLKPRVLPSELIAVGDETTLNFLKKGIIPRLSIIDLKVGRKKIFNGISDLGFSKSQDFEIISNGASTIKKELTQSVRNHIANKNETSFVIKIIGEEDLAVLPATILAPLSWHIVYGQPNKGLVLISAVEETKASFLKLLGKFRFS